MRNVAIALMPFLLAGCTIAQVEAWDAAVETKTDAAYDFSVKHGCSLPADMIARAIERRGDDYAYARYLTCPQIRTIVDAINRRLPQ